MHNMWKVFIALSMLVTVSLAAVIGSDHPSDDNHHGLHLPNLDELEHNINRRQVSDTATRVVELVVVNDLSQFNRNNRNNNLTIQRTKAIVNHVDELFRPLGVRVVLNNIIIWTERDEISHSFSTNSRLLNFRDYSIRKAFFHKHDAAMLLTNSNPDGRAGKAFMGGMCSDYSVGICRDGRNPAEAPTASAMAHQLGHLLNMNHDPESGVCSCNDPSGRCIMTRNQGQLPPPSVWSSCSTTTFQNGLYRCLSRLSSPNSRARRHSDPVCGNGIIEGDETCDCGSPEECMAPCCNARMCQRVPREKCTVEVFPWKLSEPTS